MCMKKQIAKPRGSPDNSGKSVYNYMHRSQGSFFRNP